MGLNSLVESPVLRRWISDQVVDENLSGEKYVLLNVTNDSINNLLLRELIRKKTTDYQIFIENHYEAVIIVQESNIHQPELLDKIVKTIFETHKYRYILTENFFNRIGYPGLIGASVAVYQSKIYVAINIVTIGYF
jgi:ribosomal protein S19